MRITSSGGSGEPTAAGGRSRLWLATWLAQRPDVMARVVVAYRGLLRSAAGRRQRLARGAGGTLAGAALLLALGMGALRPPDSHAAALAVDNGIVVVANDGQCSLVEAIINANSDNQVFTAAGECAKGSGADTINLPAGGAFNLLTAYGGPAFYSDNGLPLISSDITIEGNGATIERSGAPQFRILAVAPSGNLKLNHTTISGGATTAWGGGLYVGQSGQATLTGAIIFGNGAYSGGGIATKLGTVTLANSTVSGNTAGQFGGGIHANLGTVTLANSTVSSNEAGNRGGGISVFHGNTVTVNGSTIRGNAAAGGGGAVYHLGGTVALTNSTITDNTTTAGNGGGILNRGGTTTVTHATITANSAAQGGGGGLHEEHQLAQVTLVRSLVSGNSASVGNEIHRAADAGPFAANARNILGHAGLTNAQAFISFAPGNSDFNATSSDENVPLAGIIDFLDNNGGPTFTHALVSGSPAIDLASSAACASITDQRGFGRNVNGDGQTSNRECDSGAFEFGAIVATATPIASFTPTPTKTPTPSPTPLSTATPTRTPTATTGPSPTVTATSTTGPSPTATSTATAGPSPTPTSTGTPTATATAGPSPTPSSTSAPTATRQPGLDWQTHIPVVIRIAP